MWWCLKVAFYLVVFAFGGILLIGIIMLYSRFSKKSKLIKNRQRIKEDEETQGETTEGEDMED